MTLPTVVSLAILVAATCMAPSALLKASCADNECDECLLWVHSYMLLYSAPQAYIGRSPFPDGGILGVTEFEVNYRVAEFEKTRCRYEAGPRPAQSKEGHIGIDDDPMFGLPCPATRVVCHHESMP